MKEVRGSEVMLCVRGKRREAEERQDARKDHNAGAYESARHEQGYATREELRATRSMAPVRAVQQRKDVDIAASACATPLLPAWFGRAEGSLTAPNHCCSKEVYLCQTKNCTLNPKDMTPGTAACNVVEPLLGENNTHRGTNKQTPDYMSKILVHMYSLRFADRQREWSVTQ